MGVRLSGGIGPVRVSTGGRGGGMGCLTLIAVLIGLGIAWFAITWPYRLGGWAAEVPYLIVLVGGTGFLLWWYNRRLLRQQGRLDENGKRIR